MRQGQTIPLNFGQRQSPHTRAIVSDEKIADSFKQALSGEMEVVILKPKEYGADKAIKAVFAFSERECC